MLQLIPSFWISNNLISAPPQRGEMEIKDDKKLSAYLAAGVRTR
jgi:hypothetical protein